MRRNNLAVLNDATLEELEITLDLHTRELVPPSRYTAFSWSVTRHAMLEECPRRYYLNYYGSRRVREARSRIVSAVWWLKQVRTARMWIGSVIHIVAAEAAAALRDGRELGREAAVDLALDVFRAGVEASRRGAKLGDDWVVLAEHVYPDAPPSVDSVEAEAFVARLANSLLDSEAYGRLRAAPEAIAEIDPKYQSFDLTGVAGHGTVRVFAMPDVLLYDPAAPAVRIIDWKTGGTDRESIRMQAGIYRLYAGRAYDVPEEAVTFEIADLAGGGRSIPSRGEPLSAKEAEAFVRESIYNMTARMENIRSNTVSIRHFPMTSDRSICAGCGFRRACWREDA